MIPVWGVLSVIGGFLYHLSLGYYYTVGNMNSYVISYMGIAKSQSAWFSSVIIALQAISLPTGGVIAKKIGFRPVLILGIIFSSGGILLTRLTVDHGLGAYVSTYCVLFGLGMGLPYSVIFQVASSWFPEKRATVVGIISSGLGLGALVFTPIQTNVINPDDLQPVGGKYPPDVDKRVPNAFLIFGGTVLAFQIVGVLLLRKRPNNKNDEDEPSNNSVAFEHPEKDNSEGNYSPNKIEENVLQQEEVKSHSVMSALKCIDFYILWTVSFCDVVAVVLLTSTYKLYGLEQKFKDTFLSGVVMGSAAFNCFGRVTWGLTVDRFSYKCPLLTFLSLWAVLFITFPFVAGGAAGIYLYAIWVFLLFYTLAGHFVILPGAASSLFGPQNFATIYGLVYAAAAPSGLLTAAVTSQLNLDGAWLAVYSTCAAFCVIALAIGLFIRDDKGRCCRFTAVCSRVCNPCRREIPTDSESVEYAEKNIPSSLL
ncbi:hypothetical protein SprV_0501745900 [Sparganum proliferum]